MRRVLAQHSILDNVNAIRDDDEIEIFPYPELPRKELFKLERTFIHNCHPRYNKKAGRGNTFENLRTDELRDELTDDE